ncbi:DUF4129 domain-containing protein [Nesterenkonia alba]|uniref:DUF4129 domain-containing protein n=1 Tax=Nesterenkonia alba TaxID=515814 RepID=UPI0003B48EA6|nr:DUF4129 domain-containing protein [Nesterenkonia alba]
MYAPDPARRLLEDELEDPRYQREFTGPIREAIDRFLSWLDGQVTGTGPVDVPFGPVIILLLLVAALVACLLIVRPRLQRARRAEDPVRIERDITSAALRQRAGRHAAAGETDEAFRDMFRALTRAAEERGVLRTQAGGTATEIALALGRQFTGHATELRRCADLFNLSLYGGGALSEQDYTDICLLDEQLTQTPPTHETTTGTARLVAPR